MPYSIQFIWAFLGGSDDKESICNAGDRGSIPRLGDLLEKGLATYSSIIACRIPRKKETGELQSLGL